MIMLPCGCLEPAMPETLIVHKSADSNQDPCRRMPRRKVHVVPAGDQTSEEAEFLSKRTVPTLHISPGLAPHHRCVL